MTWTYRQRTGLLLHNGVLVGSGYSGSGEGKNAPELQAVRNVGPLPVGRYRIVGTPFKSLSHGPFVLGLSAVDGSETFGRSAFLIHGDSIRAPGTASRGCIILDNATRRKIWKSGDRDLEVVSGDEPVQVTT